MYLTRPNPVKLVFSFYLAIANSIGDGVETRLGTRKIVDNSANVEFRGYITLLRQKAHFNVLIHMRSSARSVKFISHLVILIVIPIRYILQGKLHIIVDEVHRSRHCINRAQQSCAPIIMFLRHTKKIFSEAKVMESWKYVSQGVFCWGGGDWKSTLSSPVVGYRRAHAGSRRLHAIGPHYSHSPTPFIQGGVRNLTAMITSSGRCVEALLGLSDIVPSLFLTLEQMTVRQLMAAICYRSLHSAYF